MDDGAAVDEVIRRLLPERLHRLRRLSGVPVAFVGTAPRATGRRRHLVLGHLAGTFGTSLDGLVVRSGLGLGGSVLRDGVPRRVDDYATTTDITHEYDRMVVHEERLTSIFAVPVVVAGEVRTVLYGAVRDRRPIGDRALRAAEVLADQLRQDVEDALHRAEPASPGTAGALAELAEIVAGTADPVLRARLARIHRELSGTPGHPVGEAPALAPREVDALRLVAVGATNVEIAARLGLSPETVKAYLRTAMRKLGARNRTAAVHTARQAGIL